MAFPPAQFGSSNELNLEVCRNSSHLVFCNSILPPDERLEHWYQYFNLTIAVVAFFVPLLPWGCKTLQLSWQHWRKQKIRTNPVDRKKRLTIAEMKMELPSLDPGPGSGAITPEPKYPQSSNRITSPKIRRRSASPSNFTHGTDNRGRSRSNIRNKMFDRLRTQRVPSPLSRRASSADRGLFPTRVRHTSPDAGLSPPTRRGRTLHVVGGPGEYTAESRNSSRESRQSLRFRDESSNRRRSKSIQPILKGQDGRFNRPRSQSVRSNFNVRDNWFGQIPSSFRNRDNSESDKAPSIFRDVNYERSRSALSIRDLCDDERVHLSHTDPLLGPVSKRSSLKVEPAPLPSFVRPDIAPSTETIDLRPGTDLELNFNPLQNFDLRITPLFSSRIGGKKEHQFATSSRSASPVRGTTRKTVVGLVDLMDIGQDALSESSIVETAQELDLLRIEKGCAGLVFRICDNLCPVQISELFHTLCQQRVGVMVMCDPDAEIVRSINFGLLIGAIFENCTILANGQRRDFFRSIRLREVMGKCADERVERPKFFVGFHDLWHTRPTAAVVRRAYKLAEFYGSTLVQGELRQDGKPQRKLPISMSGFDYLKSNESVELQRVWVNESRKVKVNVAPEPLMVARIPLGELCNMLPAIEDLLTPYDVCADLEKVSEKSNQIILPNFEFEAPPRSNFWNITSDGYEFSSVGCFPLSRGPSPKQYDALLESQQQLKALKMLHSLEDIDLLKLTDQLESYRATSQQKCLLDTLIHGLTFDEIHIYKGLDTGFGLPGEVAHVWGMSAPSETGPNHIDIFLSQKAPSDVGTVLHTFLAHHGVSREIRFEEELRLERGYGGDNMFDIPISIRNELSEATNGELLFLLQQIRISNLAHPFVDGIQKACSSLLIEQSSKASWTEIHSNRFLEGSISMQDLLQMRLDEFNRQGARKLPSIENLVDLFQMVDSLISDALFMAQRNILDALSAALRRAFDPSATWPKCGFVDVNADLIALMFFCSLRKSALEDVYLETTDRCPFFLTQPDQAAVFSELWVLGSQCDIYFGILPRALGAIIYDTYRTSLRDDPPPVEAWNGTDVFTAYSFSHDTSHRSLMASEQSITTQKFGWYDFWKERQGELMEFSALSIFCMPAIFDVLLLTLFGRGLFLTAFMASNDRMVASFALLAALLISAGNTGWIGSVGGHYLYNFAFDSMNYFLIQRLSGGFVLSIVVSVCGLIAFSVQYSPRIGGVFMAYLIVLCAYLNVIGILATMHRKHCPLTSGRMVLWRTFPFLFISPLLSTFVRGHDLLIYLIVLYSFLIILLFQYRNLCHEWSTWTTRLPVISMEEITAWYEETLPETTNDKTSGLTGDALNKAAQVAFQLAVEAYERGTKILTSNKSKYSLVANASRGLPFALWLLEKENPSPSKKTDIRPELFTKTWLVQIEQGLKNVQQLSQGLKEHSIFILFRQGRYDMAQSLGLFLVALMDHWVSVVTSAVLTQTGPYTIFRSRYGMGFCVLYFLVSAIALDATLLPYWEDNAKLPDEKLLDSQHAQIVAKKSAEEQRNRWANALIDLVIKMGCILGCTTFAVWLFVNDPGQVVMYFVYIIGYSGVLVFQFNRCFTTNVRAHVLSVFFAALVGFLIGCSLHLHPATAPFVYNDSMALMISSILAALLTTIWVWVDPDLQPILTPGEGTEDDTPTFTSQLRIGSEGRDRNLESHSALNASKGPKIECSDDSAVAQRITDLLRMAMIRPNALCSETEWSSHFLTTAMDMWRSGSIVITISNRQLFVQAGLEDSWSFSECSGGTIRITAGFLDESEIQLYWGRWHDGFAYQLTETILYHTAISVLRLSHRHACLGEHLLHKTTSISNRIEFQLATEDEGSLIRITRKTNSQLMKALCLGLDVDLEWQNVSEDIRSSILARIIGNNTAVISGTTPKDLQLEDFHVTLCLQIFQSAQQRLKTMEIHSEYKSISSANVKTPAQLQCKQLEQGDSPKSLLSRGSSAFVRGLITCSKWIAIISGGASEVERELWYSLHNTTLGTTMLWVLLVIWKTCWLIRNTWITIFLIYRRPALSRIINLVLKGASRVLVRDSITVELPEKTITGFTSSNEFGTITLHIFDGPFQERPENKEPFGTAIYDGVRLQSRQDCKAGGIVNSTYHYACGETSRFPLYKDVVEPNRTLRHRYDDAGRVVSGTLTTRTTEIAFNYFYQKYPKYSNDILKAEYHQVEAIENILSVYWGGATDENSPDDEMAVPSEKITRVIRKIGSKSYVTKFVYEHKRDPRTITELEDCGEKIHGVEPPKMFEEEEQLLEKPTNLSFNLDDLFVHHPRSHVHGTFNALPSKHGVVAKYLSKFCPSIPFWKSYWSRSVVYSKIPTWQLRTELWKLWLQGTKVDAVTACWIDELILREEPTLGKYWRLRDTGRLSQAKQALDDNIGKIVSSIEMPFEVSQTCSLPIKPADLYTMGLGKDASQITNRPQDCFKDIKDRISIIFNDVGCWPDAPGGVSNCRRDLVNGHKTIRNHVLAESAHDYGISRFQLEKNVQSLKQLPLWGLDSKTAHHGLIDNLLQTQVDEKIQSVDAGQDIVGVFIPLLRRFVKGARTKRSSREDLISCSNALLAMSAYFEHKDYNRTWQSKEVQSAWIDAWMYSYNDTNILDASEFFEMERPTMGDFREALNLYICYFLIYSVEIPEECPRVFQSTHHGISSLFGMVLKYRKGTTFGLWDHAILWRECCLNISVSQCLLPISVQSMLLSGIGLAARLAYLHVDVLLPCTSVFNPTWEIEIGTDSGRIGSKKLFSRKIDPIANGISNMSAFTPTDEGLSEKPTVVMLSNIQTIKDVKAAVLAADIIVNEFGFDDYRLHIYGAQDRQPTYTMETLQLIADRNLAGKVVLAGFGNPKKVLKDAWLFMNSSLSEGLPLAIGEAALTGVPIVATEVGGTALVLTDPDDKSRKYGEVVPPNDPMALARAQINVLAMLGQWITYTDDDGPARTLPNVFLDGDVEWITKRMYEKSEDRRKLGLMCREVVLRCFHGSRYLREHEQMYWVQWHRARMTADEDLDIEAKSLFRFGIPQTLCCEGDKEEADEIYGGGNKGAKKRSAKFRWQDFSGVPRRKTKQEKSGGQSIKQRSLDLLRPSSV